MSCVQLLFAPSCRATGEALNRETAPHNLTKVSDSFHSQVKHLILNSHCGSDAVAELQDVSTTLRGREAGATPLTCSLVGAPSDTRQEERWEARMLSCPDLWDLSDGQPRAIAHEPQTSK